MLLEATFTITGAALRFSAFFISGAIVGVFLGWKFSKAKVQQVLDAEISKIQNSHVAQTLAADEKAVVDFINTIKSSL